MRALKLTRNFDRICAFEAVEAREVRDQVARVALVVNSTARIPVRFHPDFVAAPFLAAHVATYQHHFIIAVILTIVNLGFLDV